MSRVETAASRAAERPIKRTADRGELLALVQASHVRRLTDAERLRLAGLTYVVDETMERARLLRDRHPDVFAQVHTNTSFALERTYEPNRAAAAAAGRTVAEPSSEIVAEIDAIADEYRATREVPPEFVGYEARCRAAYQAALRPPRCDMHAALQVWFEWTALTAAHNKFVTRQAQAIAAINGRSGGGGNLRPPEWSVEFEDAVGGHKQWRSVPAGPGNLAE